MSRPTSVLFLCFLALALCPASGAAESLLVSDEQLHFRGPGGGRLILLESENPAIQLSEVLGAEVLVRLTPISDEGAPIGGGKLVLLNPSETRNVRLRDPFGDLLSEAFSLRVEVLHGRGRVEVFSSGLQSSEVGPTDATATRRRGVKLGLRGWDLIAAEEQSGALSSETALLYRVYALFHDARLPARYQGGVLPPDSLYLGEAKNRFNTLSAETQALLRPFFIPPAYAGSWANAGASKVTGPNVTSCDLFGAWLGMDVENVPVTVWWDENIPGAGARADEIRNEIKTRIWRPIADLMSPHLPLSDEGLECNGGKGNLDIYISDIDVNLLVPRGGVLGVTPPYSGCQNSPAYIALRRNASNSVVVHEIFHAFQWSYPLDGCLTDEKYGWWTEASATWSQDFVYGKTVNDEHGFAPWYLNRPEERLDFRNRQHEYGAYLLPFFVHHKTGSAAFVPRSWEKSATQPALEAVDESIPGGFAAIWPDFALYNWNLRPVDHYQTWDFLIWKALLSGFLNVVIASDAAIPVKVDLPLLSATYHNFRFDDSVRSVVFWNGVTSKLAIRDATFGVLGPQYVQNEVHADLTKGAHVRALIRMGQTWKEENWTDQPWVMFCRDVIAERIDELVLIVSNSEFKERNRKLQPLGLAPVLDVSNVGCWRWKGTATLDAGGDGGLTRATANVTWTRVAGSSIPLAIQYTPQGTLDWSISQPGCGASGTTSLSGALANLLTYNFVAPGSPLRRSYNGVGNGPSVGVCAASFSFPWLTLPPQPIGPGNPIARFVRVDASGRVMRDSFMFPGAPPSWTWHFEAQRE